MLPVLEPAILVLLFLHSTSRLQMLCYSISQNRFLESELQNVDNLFPSINLQHY
jgi:hypothetical protein